MELVMNVATPNKIHSKTNLIIPTRAMIYGNARIEFPDIEYKT